MKFRYNKLEPIGFQLAPMIDIVFLLLIFFVVNQKLALTELDLEVKIPSADGSKKSRDINEIIINIRKDGTPTVNNQKLTLAVLEDKVKKLSQADKNIPIRLRADKQTQYESIVDVINVCRKAGLFNISFNVASSEENS